MFGKIVLLAAIAAVVGQDEMDGGNREVLKVLYEVFNSEGCIDWCDVQVGFEASQRMGDFGNFSACVGWCAYEIVNKIANEVQTSPEEVISSVNAALHDIFFNGCGIGALVSESGCHPPDERRMGKKEASEAMCEFMHCARRAINESINVKCSGGRYTFVGVVQYRMDQLCWEPSGEREDRGNAAFMKTLHKIFNREGCIDWCEGQGIFDEAFEKENFTDGAFCVGNCSNATLWLADHFQVDPEVIILDVAGALNDMFFNDCRLYELAYYYGCEYPMKKRGKPSPKEVASLCGYFTCVQAALTSDANRNCTDGLHAFVSVAEMHKYHVCQIRQ